jgi:hypothetical protein
MPKTADTKLITLFEKYQEIRSFGSYSNQGRMILRSILVKEWGHFDWISGSKQGNVVS